MVSFNIFFWKQLISDWGINSCLNLLKSSLVTYESTYVTWFENPGEMNAGLGSLLWL